MIVDGLVSHDADGKGGGLAFVEHEGAEDSAFVLFQEDIGGQLQAQVVGEERRPIFVQLDPVRVPRVVECGTALQEEGDDAPDAIDLSDQLSVAMRVFR